MDGKRTILVTAVILAIVIVSGLVIYSSTFNHGCNLADNLDNLVEGNIEGSRSENRILTISTTTSLYDTGMLDQIATFFKEGTGIEVHFIPKGTGAAINDAINGVSDGVMVHALSKEVDFMQKGYGVNRKVIAYNFFIIVGPKSDPSSIKGLELIDSLEKVVEEGRNGNAIWVSRDDGSGTNTKEIFLWEKAGFNYDDLREEDWFRSSGTGMGNTLSYCSNVGAYTLSDMGTYLKYTNDGLINLDIMVDEGEELINVYSIITVNPEKWEKDIGGMTEFTNWLTSEKGQRFIGELSLDEYEGQHLFYPVMGVFEEKPEIGLWLAKYGFIESNGKLTECPEEYRYIHNLDVGAEYGSEAEHKNAGAKRGVESNISFIEIDLNLNQNSAN